MAHGRTRTLALSLSCVRARALSLALVCVIFLDACLDRARARERERAKERETGEGWGKRVETWGGRDSCNYVRRVQRESCAPCIRVCLHARSCVLCVSDSPLGLKGLLISLKFSPVSGKNMRICCSSVTVRTGELVLERAKTNILQDPAW